MVGNLTYRTSENDVLDAICHAHYGKTSGIVERVLNANPGLCEYDVFLPAGVEITLPEIDVTGFALESSDLAFSK